MSEIYTKAVDDFRRARGRGEMKALLNQFTGASSQLLSYEEVRHKLRAQGSAERGLQDIPLNAIVGSVGRYTDFTRDFLPTSAVSEQRWARVKAATESLAGLPPIEVYKIGEVYFVKDGNHRVSVARELDAGVIQAYVTELRTRIPLTPDVQPDDLIMKAEYVEFLETTRLDELRPEADLSVTVPGQYPVLLEHIAVHRHYIGLELQREVPEAEAVTHWYDTVYLPVVQTIRELGSLHAFPGRTETDLYLWIAEHSAVLKDELGWEVKPAAAVTDLASRFGEKPGNPMLRLGEKLLDALTQETLVSGPEPGQWRREKQAERKERNLFGDILVPISGDPDGWCGLEQAVMITQKEGGRLHGLHVAPGENEAVAGIRAEFNRQCQEAGVEGKLFVAQGEIAKQICSYARWTDLIVVNLAYPPAPQIFSRLSSGFRALVQRCPRPVLAVPGNPVDIKSALLAYDGSPKAQEALFLATYMAGQWGIALTVATVATSESGQRIQKPARQYLETHGIEAGYILETGPVASTLIRVAEAGGCDLFVMGGYGAKPVLEVVLGSVVDQILRESHKPTLICR